MPHRICYVASEMAPFSKTGGLADFGASFTRYLADAGHRVHAFVPLHRDTPVRRDRLEPVPEVQHHAVWMGTETYPLSLMRLKDGGTGTGGTGGGPEILFVHSEPLYDRGRIYTDEDDEIVRFAFLARAALVGCQFLKIRPDVFHCNDWQTALLPFYLRTHFAWDDLFASTRCVLSIHNAAYQGVFGAEQCEDVGIRYLENTLPPDDHLAGRINCLKLGVLHADAVTTVSPSYAAQLRDPARFGALGSWLFARREVLRGILNGIDADVWDPAADDYLPAAFDARDLAGKDTVRRALLAEVRLTGDAGVPVFGIVSRLTGDKGCELLTEVLPRWLGRNDVRLVILGTGERRYEAFCRSLAMRFGSRVFFHNDYDEGLAHRIVAGSDFFLMPSRTEPCGLTQMYALRYGTVPVVHRTGGLADSVAPLEEDFSAGTGIAFETFDAGGLQWALALALELHGQPDRLAAVRRRGMAVDHSWSRSGRQYLDLYAQLVAAADGP